MHLIDPRVLGIVILLLLGMLIIAKRKATGSILDKPKGDLLVWLVNSFNLFFLLVVNPLAAILLIMHRPGIMDPTHLTIATPWLLVVLEIVGLTLYAIGILLMAWALIQLGGVYQLGGIAPRPNDEMITKGPYGLVRHPMYIAALSIALGLACLVQSVACFAVFCLYLVLILLLVPREEEGLRQAYGPSYLVYQQKTSKLIPFVY